MKKQFNNLLNSENARLRLNPFCELHRWTKDAIGTPVDSLEVIFHLTSVCSHNYVIEARTWQEVVAEVQKYQAIAFADAAATLNKELVNGYIRG